ncbi:hypothetical protein QUC31_020460 [Theobroma cacao]|uniref:Uncharacterized protein n=1 Tax=Theobroma cacao TaxID=3641 RepID=A0A061GJH6_THECC|nr:Uncharacterized protein TCM_037389 [Theobroma cacao]WRX34541.1 hypothetical protein QQP08_027028 [Theobroma cacao]
MEPIAMCRSSRSCSYEKWVAIVLTILAVVSPLYVNRKSVSEAEFEEQSMDLASWLRLLLVLLILAFAFLLYLNQRFTRSDRHWIRSSSSSSYERLVAIGLVVLGVVSPLYTNRATVSELEPDEQPINFASWLPLLLLILILAIALSLYCDRSFTRFDPNWIHRVGGSSAGILLILLVLAFVLKCKASGLN